MRRLIFASNNRHKLEEVRAALEGAVEVVSLAEAGLSGEIPETAETLEGNALQKAEWVWSRVCRGEVDGVFADDTGLEVEALGGAPGVYSARYAGEHCSFDDNIDKLLAALDGESNRRACFRTVICLIEGVQGVCSTSVAGLQSRQQGVQGVQGVVGRADGTPQGANVQYFEGRVDGQILTERHSNGEGFGYDPVFMPDRFAVSFAEMPLEVKNRISHRGLAVEKLKRYFKES